MADDLPPATPIVSGDKQSPTNASSHKQGEQPKEELNPSNLKKRKRKLLTRGERIGFWGDVFVILWIWSDLAGSHGLTRLILLCLTLSVAHGVICYFLSKIWK